MSCGLYVSLNAAALCRALTEQPSAWQGAANARGLLGGGEGEELLWHSRALSLRTELLQCILALHEAGEAAEVEAVGLVRQEQEQPAANTSTEAEQKQEEQ